MTMIIMMMNILILSLLESSGDEVWYDETLFEKIRLAGAWLLQAGEKND